MGFLRPSPGAAGMEAKMEKLAMLLQVLLASWSLERIDMEGELVFATGLRCTHSTPTLEGRLVL